MRTPVRGNVTIATAIESPEENGDFGTLRCYDCNVNFTSEHYLLGHLLHHIRQPTVLVKRLQQAPIKLTFKSKSHNNFEIINSPNSTAGYQLSPDFLAGEGQISSEIDNSEGNTEDSGTYSAENLEEGIDNFEDITEENAEGTENTTIVNFSPNYAGDTVEESPPGCEEYNSTTNSPSVTNDSISNDVPGSEPTPPPESPSPTEYPKIRIKTTGLLKEPLTITEITDDNPNGDYRPSEVIEITNNNENTESSNFWTPCLEDPLKLPDGDRDDSNLLSNFLNNNNDQAKAFGITTTDSEFISLDRLDDRNRNALQVYNPSTSTVSANPLDSLTGLPMQQLAEQVSRLQPSSSGMHQQNVLINIQQFPQAPPQPPHGYQHPPMYPPHPPHPGIPAQPPPMYQPYQYQPSPMYYPPAPNYPPAPHMPPPPQMPQPNQQMPQQPRPPQQAMPPPQQPPQYRQAMPPRPPPPPRQFNQQPQRGPPPRQPMQPRQRATMMRSRGGMIATAVRAPRPRMQGVPSVQNMNGTQNNMQGQQRIIKRTPEQIQNLQAKKKRMDVLVPDKNDDADCQVIAVQPKNTDGGLPQIQSVQGGTPDPADNVMHLSDSITLSVRNPPPRTQSPKKSDAKVVANILATRGITVTATPKPKEKTTPSKEGPQPSVAINLNSAVSIIPTAKNNTSPNPKTANDSRLPTVDLTDDTVPDPPRNSPVKQTPISAQKNNPRGTALPFRCDLCPAQYPTAAGLNKHRQSYHKTGSPCEIGIPLVDLKQPGVVQKLTSLGIYNFIPLPSSTPDGNFALPVVSVNAARNSAVCNLNALGASSILTLGPVRSLPKTQLNNVPPSKQ